MPLLMDATAAWMGALKTKAEPAPLRVGRFEIRRELGEGAFGKVYQAYDGQLDRLVALKVAKLDRDIEHRVKRFLREAKSAANLRHPHIVPLFEFGQEEDVFYLVSAFIDGQTLQSRLSGQTAGNPRFKLQQGAEIVRRLAEALAYAHGQGIVHRDVKPGNVMLDPQDQPILLDFGLATRQEEAEQLTYDGQVLGTPLYMAPEQAKGKDGKSLPESDQYALGVMLFELIAGEPPFQGTAQMVMFHHMQTDLPSPRQKNSAVPRDLETICQKCLEKDPTRRYSSCQALADDLRRWQEGEPIAARRAGAIERTTRWCRKNPLSASLMGAVAVSLVLGVVVSATFAVQSEANARRARENELIATRNESKEKKARLDAQHSESKAKESAMKAQKAEMNAKAAAKQAEDSAQQEKVARRQAERVGIYLRDLFAANDPQGLGLLGLRSLQEQGQTLTARELLDRGARQVETELQDEPLTRAALMDVIGEVYRTLGLFDSAKPLLEESLKLRRAGLPPNHPELADTLTHLGSWNFDKGFFVQAGDYYGEALAIREQQKEAGELAASDLLLRWALAKTFLEDEDAPELAKRAIDIRIKVLKGQNHRDVAIAKAVWAATLFDSGKPLQAAIPSLEAVHFLLEEASPDKEAGLKAVTEFQKAMALFNLRQYSWAEGSLRNSVGLFQKLLGKDHVYNAIPLYELGNSLALQGKYSDAEPIWLECLAIVRKTTGLEHPRAIMLIESLSDLYARRKQATEGRKLWKETVEAQESRYGTDYPWRAKTLMKMGKFEAEWGDIHEAERVAREVMRILTDKHAKLHSNEVISLQNMGMALGDEGDIDLVREIYHFVIDCESQNSTSAPTRDAFATLNNFGDILACRGQFLEAEPYLHSAMKLSSQSGIFGTGDHDLTLAPYNLGRVAWVKGEFAAAETKLRDTARQIDRNGAKGENIAAGSLVQLLVQREQIPQALDFLPLLAKSSNENQTSHAANTHVQVLLRILHGDPEQARQTFEREKERHTGNTNTEALAYLLRSRLVLVDPADEDAARKSLEGVGPVLALQPDLVSALHVKAVCHLRLKQPEQAIATLQKLKENQAVPISEIGHLLLAQAALQDESNQERQKQFREALERAEAACATHRENKDPLERRFVSWYWLDLKCHIAEGRKLVSK